MLIINISPPKCGTTSLYFCLTRCAEVSTPKIKEPRFFAGHTVSGSNRLPAALQPTGNFNSGYKWFNELFDSSDQRKHRIDFTTYYSITPETPSLLAKTSVHTGEDIKLIMVLRDPVARFVSHYYQYQKMGIRIPPIAELISDDSEISRFMLSFADYEKTVSRFSAQFGTENILFLDFADMVDCPTKIERQVSSFLGLEDFRFKPTTTEKNVAGRPRNHLVQRLIFGDTTKKMASAIPKSLKPFFLQFRKKLVQANTVAQPYPTLNDTSHALLKQHLEGPTKYYRHMVSKS